MRKHISCFLIYLAFYNLNICAAKPVVAVDSTKIAIANLQIAKNYYKKGDYPQSLTIALRVYDLASKNENYALKADAENLIGLVRVAQGEAESAIPYFKNAMVVNVNVSDKSRLIVNYMNLGLAYSELTRLDSAEIYLKLALRLSLRTNAKNLIAMTQNHLGKVFIKKGDYPHAERMFYSVLGSTTFKSSWENSFAYAGLAEIRALQKKFKDAGSYADSAYSNAIKTNAKWDAAEALEIAYKSYWSAGDAVNAYKRLLLYKIYKDSLFSTEKEKQIAILLLRNKSFENDKLQKQIRIAQQKRKIDILIIIVTLLLAGFLILSGYYILRRYVKANRLNKKLKEINDITLNQNRIFEAENLGLSEVNHQKDKLFSIIGHDLRSPFAVVQSTIQMFKTGDLNAKELEMLINEVEKQLESASEMVNNLLSWAGSQSGGLITNITRFDLFQILERILDVLSIVADRKAIKIECKHSLPFFVNGDEQQIQIILQNLISNAIKYTREYGTISIYDSREDGLILSIQDNGVGMDNVILDNILKQPGNHKSTFGTNNEKGIGLGLQLVKDFALKNDIAISAESVVDNGTTFQLKFMNY